MQSSEHDMYALSKIQGEYKKELYYYLNLHLLIEQLNSKTELDYILWIDNVEVSMI